MDSYMESDYVMKFEVYDYNHDITKTHVIFTKEPDMKPHGCSTKNPSTIRAHVIIMKFLETIYDYFKTNDIRCRMNDILDVIFNSVPGILRSPTITLVNFNYNYKSNRYRDIQFILEDKQACYNETFYILAISDNDIQPYDVKMDPRHRTIRDPRITELTQKIDNEVRKYINGREDKKFISKAALKEIVATRLVVRDQVITTKDDTNAWDTFLNEKKMERLHKDDDKFKYFITLNEVLDKIDTPSRAEGVEDCYKLIRNYTAENDTAAIQRGSILLTEFINDNTLENGHVGISIYKTNSSFMNFIVIAMFTLSHDNSIEKWAVCKFK